MGMGFASTWLRQVSPPPLLHKTTLTTGYTENDVAYGNYQLTKTVFLLTLKNGNPVAMCIPGEDASSRTGRTLSPTSVPNGRKISGSDGSARELTETTNKSRQQNTSTIFAIGELLMRKNTLDDNSAATLTSLYTVYTHR